MGGRSVWRWAAGLGCVATGVGLAAYLAVADREQPLPSGAPSSSAVVNEGPAPPGLADPVVEVRVDVDVVRTSPLRFDLHSLQGALLVTTGDAVFEVNGAVLEPRSRFVEGDGSSARVAVVSDLRGHWPDDAWAVGLANAPVPGMLGGAGMGHGRTFRWETDAWKVSDEGLALRFAWSRGRVLAGWTRWLGGDGALPVRSKLGDGSCGRRLDRLECTAVVDDHVFALGTLEEPRPTCEGAAGEMVVELFGPGDGPSRVLRLPPVPAVDEGGDGEPRVRLLAARSSDEVVVAGFVELAANARRKVGHAWPYLARFDGKDFVIARAPPTRQFPVGLVLGEHGLWLITAESRHADARALLPEHRTEAWRREGEGPWRRIILPRVEETEVQPLGIAVDRSERVWLSVATPRSQARPPGFALLRVAAPR
jgi:hypothetical protein